MHELRTVIVEPNVVVRKALEKMLSDAGYRVIATLDSPKQLINLEECPENLAVVVIGGRSATLVAAIGEIKDAAPSAAVVVLGGRPDNSSMLEAIRSGANVYLNDTTSCETFYKSLALASADLAVMSVTRETADAEPGVMGEACATPETTRPDGPRDRKRGPSGSTPADGCALSPRESSILQFLQEGASNKLIARRLELTEATVKVHLKSILRKIRVKNRTQAAVWAIARNGSGRAPSQVKSSATGDCAD